MSLWFFFSKLFRFNVTSLRIDPDYVLYYVHWTRSNLYCKSKSKSKSKSKRSNTIISTVKVCLLWYKKNDLESIIHFEKDIYICPCHFLQLFLSSGIFWNQSWWNFSLRLLCTGAIPFLFLSYINLRIYSRIRQNSQSSVRFTSFSILMIIFVSILTLISKRNRSISAKKAGNLATILILIGDLSFDNHTI